MDNSQVESYPEKRCVTCGFLYGLTLHGADRDNLMFDPDVMRAHGYYSKIMSPQPGLVSSLPYSHHSKGAQRVTWQHIQVFCCYRNVFEEISARKGLSPHKSEREELRNLLHQDRSTCSGYFRYHHGFTARQHAELLLEDKRTKRQEKHAMGLTFATLALVLVTGMLCLVTALPHTPGWLSGFVSIHCQALYWLASPFLWF